MTVQPDNAKSHFGLGKVLLAQGKPDAAVEHYERVLLAKPDYAEAHNNLGMALAARGELGRAAECCRQALALRPGYASGHYNLGRVLEGQGKLDEAMAQFEQAAANAPDDAGFQWNLGLAHLLRGDFQAGWRGYEWRWQTDQFSPRSFDRPAWEGETLAGRTILLHAEQGYGDTIQFIRYAYLVKERGARVIVECQPGLERLLGSIPTIDQLVPWGGALPPFDYHAPLLSLPCLFATDLETIPATVPYLYPQPSLAEAWRRRLGAGLNVGIAWRGNPQNTIGQRKAIAIESIASLCGIPGIDWISLQKDATPREIEFFSVTVRFAITPL